MESDFQFDLSAWRKSSGLADQQVSSCAGKSNYKKGKSTMRIRKSILIGLLVSALAGGWLARSIAQEGTPTTAVTILDHAKVGAAFARPSFNVLFTGMSGEGNFVVMAARRDKAGEVEVHNVDSDIFYMLSGTATFVTGGKTAEPRTTAPGEVRGSSIEGGETHQVSQGEVIVIPPNVPHWFKEVHGPLNYFVVKVH